MLAHCRLCNAPITINPERMLAALSADMLAPDLARYLVGKGAPAARAACLNKRGMPQDAQ